MDRGRMKRSFASRFELLWSTSPYATLGLETKDEEYTQAEIKKAYRQAALRYHPDRQTSDSDKTVANERFAKIFVAYETLLDIERRKQVDKDLKLAKQADLDESETEIRRKRMRYKLEEREINASHEMRHAAEDIGNLHQRLKREIERLRKEVESEANKVSTHLEQEKPSPVSVQAAVKRDDDTIVKVRLERRTAAASHEAAWDDVRIKKDVHQVFSRFGKISDIVVGSTLVIIRYEDRQSVQRASESELTIGKECSGRYRIMPPKKNVNRKEVSQPSQINSLGMSVDDYEVMVFGKLSKLDQAVEPE